MRCRCSARWKSRCAFRWCRSPNRRARRCAAPWCMWALSTDAEHSGSLGSVGGPMSNVEERGLRMLKEFREFAMKGNVVDLAVGVIIGAAFGAIVNSLVGDVVMPIIGAATGGLDLSNSFVPLSKSVTANNLAEAKKQGAVLAYGNLITL